MRVKSKISMAISGVIAAGIGITWPIQTAFAQQNSQDMAIEEVIVTARKREESLVDVPIAITAVSGAEMERANRRSIADIASTVPGLNINADSVGRAFVSIRGIGTALQAGVQPGVGLFLDGIYVPYTSFVNNPTLDIARIEVLRGPQGTLYGKNTLAGAINVVTKPTSDEFEGKVYASWSEEDASSEFGLRISGPIVPGTLNGRLAATTRSADGYWQNRLIGGDAWPNDADQVNGTLAWSLSDETTLTVNAYALDVEGGTTAYSHVDGVTDYRDNIQLNVLNAQDLEYTGGNIKLETSWPGLDTEFTAIAAFDRRESDGAQDADFLSLDIVRRNASEQYDTASLELRFDTQFSEEFSTLVGVFASREETDQRTVDNIVPASAFTQTDASIEGDTYSVFATAVWRFAPEWEMSFGARYDEEERDLSSALSFPGIPGVVLTDPDRSISSSDVAPRVTLTRFLSDEHTVYASVAKGYRGGGFNGASVPADFLEYDGDTVWTYELGSKGTYADGRLYLSGAIYYNDYTDFIGQNALTTGPSGGLVSIDLNLGDVESYGLEVEATWRVTDNWTLSGAVSLMDARITNQDGWIAVTGTELATDRLLFQPDWTGSLDSDFRFPVGAAEITWNLNVSGKGSRPGSSFDPNQASIMESYSLVNTSLMYSTERFEIIGFANNIFDEEYFESFIDGSLLANLGLLDQDLGILGAPRNVGIRATYYF